jgi:threonine/homoserine/homoserine lactone efflux protein
MERGEDGMGIGALFITAFVVGLSGAMLPGPFLTTAIAESIHRGFWAGPWMVLGHAVLELALVLALLGGLAKFLVRSDVTSGIALLGGIFLIFLGLTMIRDALGSKISPDGIQSSHPMEIRMHPAAAGIMVSFTNPLWYLWWATIGLSYISIAMKSGPIGLASFFSGHITADLAWYSLVALAVSGGRKFINQRIYNFVLLACGTCLLGLGGYFIYLGFHP